MALEDQDKSEQPTAYRLEEAKKQGEVSKSAEVSGLVILAVFAITLAMTASWIAVELSQATIKTIAFSGAHPVLGSDMLGWLKTTYYPVLQSMSPLILAVIVAAMVANVFQTGPIFSTHPITPDFKRMNPMQAIKRVFSMRSVLEMTKLMLKMGFLAILLYAAYRTCDDFIAQMIMNEPTRLPEQIRTAFIKTSIYVLAVLALMALVDFFMTRREFMKKMRMSRRDVRDEVKKRDGDPEVKSKQKQLIRDLLKKARSVAKVSEADVILTNPTHVAVALKYCPTTMRAPIVLSKGAGYVGEQIRRVARQHQIPIVRMPTLARRLYRECAIEAPVSDDFYARLAVVYRWLYSQKGKALL